MGTDPAGDLPSGVTALLEGYRRGTWSVTDVMARVAGRLDVRDRTVGAFTATDMDAALRRAATMDERLGRVRDGLPPLFGVPVGVKETIDVAGLPTSWGLASLRGRRPTADAVVVARLRAAGAIIIGMTRSPSLAWSLSTDGPLVVGRTSNPRYPGQITGGSSGGSAAAVADGMVSIALGSDTGGSIRLPAGWCGVVGHKPTYGVVPLSGVAPLAPGLDVVGPIAGTVDDLAIALSVISRGATSAPVDGWPASVGFCFVGLDEASGVPDALRRVRAAVREAGVPTHDVDVPFADGAVLAAYTTIQLHEAYASHRVDHVLSGLSAHDVPASIRRRWERGAAVDAMTLRKARDVVDRLRREVHGHLQAVPVVVSPVASGPSPAAGQPVEEGAVARAVLPHTVVQNLLGLPACAFAVQPGGRATPAALQVTGLPGADDAVLGLTRSILEHVTTRDS